jgi:hypothetical protein
VPAPTPPSSMAGKKPPMIYPEWNLKMARAETRCRRIARSEAVLGFTDNADTYAAMAGEFYELRHWVLLIRMHDAEEAAYARRVYPAPR